MANNTNAPEKGVEIRSCTHCGGTGTCFKGKTVDIDHSCEWCVRKSGIKTDNIFPVVACAYCDGKGHTVIDLKMQRPRQPRGKGNKNAN